MDFPSFAKPVGNPASPFDRLIQAQQRKREQEALAMEQFFRGRDLNIRQQHEDAYASFMGSQERRADVQDKRLQFLIDKEQKKDVAKAIPEISSLLDPNSPTFNPALAANIGQINDINYKQTNLPPLPSMEAPQRPQAPGFVAENILTFGTPAPSPERASEIALQNAGASGGMAFGPGGEDVADRAAQEAITQQQQVDTFSRNLAEFDQRQKQHTDQLAAYQQQKQQAQANPVYEGTSPLGPVRFAPTTGIQGRENRSADLGGRILQYANALKKDDPQKAFRVEQIGMAARLLKDEDKVWDLLKAELTRDSAEMMAGERNKTTIAAAGMRRRAGDDALRADREELKLEGSMDQIVQKIIQNTGYKEDAVANKKFNQMATVFEGATKNPALAAAGAGMWVKQAQGGTGVISDSDMNQFWNKMGGIVSPERIEHEVSMALSGRMGRQRQKQVAEAVSILGKTARKNIDAIGDQIEARLYPLGERVPSVDDRIQTYRDTYAGGTKRKTKARNPGSGSGMPAPSVSPEMVTITNQKTGETKRVTREEAARMGAQ